MFRFVRDFNFHFKKNGHYDWSVFIFLNVVISAVVGAFFGYYGSSLVGSSLQTGDTFIRRISQNQVFNEESVVIDVAKKSSPAVVSIIATKDLVILQQNRGSVFNNFCNDPFFRQFFGPSECATPQPQPAPKTQRQEVAAGSGFIVNSDGLIVTNKHVVDIDKADFTVITSNGKKYPAKVLAKDPNHDLAVLKISGSNLPTLKLGNSDELQIGQSVIAIGNTLGEFSNTVSRGVVSGLSRSIIASSQNSSEKLEQLIQTDAAINPGNSGGPLLNLRGEVIGINTAIAQGAQNVGFAIPINQIKKAVNDTIQLGRIVYPFLGVRYTVITPELKDEKKLSVDYGVLVASSPNNPAVVAGSPADKAGLKEGDIILEVNGKKLNADNDLAKIIQSLSVGSKINLKILRDGEIKVVTATLEEKK